MRFKTIAILLAILLAVALPLSVSAVVTGNVSVGGDDETTIAAWEFDATDKSSGDKLKEYGNADDGYAATIGSGTLTMSVDGESNRALEWSDAEYGSDESDIVPIMAAGKKNLWGSPYIDIAVDASDAESLTFTISMGGSNKAPASWQLSYSVDGETFTEVEDASFTIDSETRKILTAYFSDYELPDEVLGEATLTLRLAPVSTTTIEGGDTSENTSSGEIALNNIYVKGVVSNTDETEDTESTEDAEETEGTEATEDTEETEGTEATEDVEETEGTEATEDTEETEGTEATEDTEETEGTEATEDTEETEGTEATEDTEETENTDATEDTEETKPVYILGDADGDGNVSIVDATYIQRHLANLSVTETFSILAADADGDGNVTIVDATYIQRFLAALSCPDGIGESVNG